MADDFDFNVAPAQDEEINMDPRESDHDSSDGEAEPNFGSIEAELMGEDPGNDASSIDSEEAEFRRRVHALISAEAEESGASDSFGGFSDEDGEDDEDSDAELGFGMPPFADFESNSDDSDGSNLGYGMSESDSDPDAEPRLRSRDHNHLGYDLSDYEDELLREMLNGNHSNSDSDSDSDTRSQTSLLSLESLPSVATEDSWTEHLVFDEAYDRVEVEASDKVKAVMRRQNKYRDEQRRYEEALEKENKELEFTKFGQLPPELRLRIWELHCPDMQRSNRVLQMMLNSDGFLTTGPTMAHQTRRLRRFMRICHETRALGERFMPDTLSIGVSQYDDGVLRYNAQKDIVLFQTETSDGLCEVDWFLAEQDEAKKKRMQTRVALPHTGVRNIAMLDMEVRSREPGSYLDYYYGSRVIEMVSRHDASHRAPQELRDAGFLNAFEYLFPNVENIYVTENGAPRRIDAWIGKQYSYERHHIRTQEDIGSDFPERIEYLYCWHAPPKGFKGRLTEAEQTEADEDKDKVDKAASDKDKVDDNDKDDDKEEEDFKDDCVINHFAALRKKGVRFSRMLCFETEEGADDYYRLRQYTCPNGEWPNDHDGRPVQDALPTTYDARLDFGIGSEDDEDDESEEDDSIVVSDDSEGEDGDDDGDSGSMPGLVSDEDVDDLEILGSESVPLEAIFSSPEPESEEEEKKSKPRGKKRRVVSDSEDEEEDKEEEEEEAGPSRRSKKRRVVDSDDDDEDDVVVTKSTNKKPIVIDDDEEEEEEEEESSHTEEGDDDEDSEEEEEEEHPKKLSLMQMLQQNRKDNPVSDEEASDNEDDAEDYAGDYGGEDEEEEEDDE